MSMWTASPDYTDYPDSWTWISNHPDQLLNFRQASDFPPGSRSTPSPQLLSQIFYLQVVIRLWSSSLFSFAKSAASSGSVPINFQCWKIRFNLWNKQLLLTSPSKAIRLWQSERFKIKIFKLSSTSELKWPISWSTGWVVEKIRA